MARVTIVYSLLMMALGLGMYLGTGTPSWTALIPAFFGAVLLTLGLLAFNDNLRKHAMHAAAALALLAFLASAGVLIARGFARPLAAAEQVIMAFLSAGFVGLCVRSFIQARRARAQREAGGG